MGALCDNMRRVHAAAPARVPTKLHHGLFSVVGVP